MPVLTWCSGRSMIATVVASAPVPPVVGTPNSGSSGPGIGVPLPIGGLR